MIMIKNERKELEARETLECTKKAKLLSLADAHVIAGSSQSKNAHSSRITLSNIIYIRTENKTDEVPVPSWL